MDYWVGDLRFPKQTKSPLVSLNNHTTTTVLLSSVDSKCMNEQLPEGPEQQTCLSNATGWG